MHPCNIRRNIIAEKIYRYDKTVLCVLTKKINHNLHSNSRSPINKRDREFNTDRKKLHTAPFYPTSTILKSQSSHLWLGTLSLTLKPVPTFYYLNQVSFASSQF